jgi:hypothetical protein
MEAREIIGVQDSTETKCFDTLFMNIKLSDAKF